MARKWKPRWHRLDEETSTPGTESPLLFDASDLDSARATMSSNELVKSMYEEAREKAKDLGRMAQVTVTLTRRVAINHSVILASLAAPGLTEQYGVEFTMQADNTFYFQKV